MILSHCFIKHEKTMLAFSSVSGYSTYPVGLRKIVEKFVETLTTYETPNPKRRENSWLCSCLK
jgi:hypothetical protein